MILQGRSYLGVLVRRVDKSIGLKLQLRIIGVLQKVVINRKSSIVVQQQVTYFLMLDFSKLSVFDLRPQAHPSRNDYAGTVIPMGISYYSQLRDMDPGQKMRRFKISNFK